MSEPTRKEVMASLLRELTYNFDTLEVAVRDFKPGQHNWHTRCALMSMKFVELAILETKEAAE